MTIIKNNFSSNASNQIKVVNVDWLKTRTINGYGVVSFCLLKLKGLTVWPLPAGLGLSTTSCAYRCAVTDTSGGKSEPSVYVLGRNTDMSIISYLGPTIFSWHIEKIETSISKTSQNVEIDAKYSDGSQMFSATINHSKIRTHSELFNSAESFDSFIKIGASSYTPSINHNKYSRVDLETDSNIYEPVVATINFNGLDEIWSDTKLVFDSAYRAGGKQYKLKYLGSVPA